MQKEFIIGLSSFMLGVVFFTIVLVLTDNTYFKGYKDGQIDCLNGKVKMELKVKEDKSTEWVYKENLK